MSRRTVILGFIISMMFMYVMARLGYAEPTVSGPTGLIDVPSADALRYKEWSAGISIHPAVSGNARSAIRYKFNLGTFNNLELGFIGNDRQEGVFINAKFSLLSENTRNPLAMALGFQNLSSFDQTAVYLVTSKRFNENVTAHFGFSACLQGKLTPRVMAGTELFLLKNNMALVADVTGAEDDWNVNAGTRFYLTPQCTVGVYVYDIVESEQGALRAVGQVSWTDFL